MFAYLRRHWLARVFSTVRRPTIRTPRRCRLLLESLEERTVPALFFVNALTDSGSGSGNSGDLRLRHHPGQQCRRQQHHRVHTRPDRHDLARLEPADYQQ